MRLNKAIVKFFKISIEEEIPEAKIYLFGSRANDEAMGGDIDLMVLTHKPIDKKLFRSIRIEFYKKFGWQKIDLINFTFDDQSVFKQLIKNNAIEL